MRVFVLARHGESELNRQRRVNGDPSVPVTLSERGEEEARGLGAQLAHLPLDLGLDVERRATAPMTPTATTPKRT